MELVIAFIANYINYFLSKGYDLEENLIKFGIITGVIILFVIIVCIIVIPRAKAAEETQKQAGQDFHSKAGYSPIYSSSKYCFKIFRKNKTLYFEYCPDIYGNEHAKYGEFTFQQGVTYSTRIMYTEASQGAYKRAEFKEGVKAGIMSSLTGVGVIMGGSDRILIENVYVDIIVNYNVVYSFIVCDKYCNQFNNFFNDIELVYGAIKQSISDTI